MPHISVKLWPGSSDAQKAELTDAIAEQVRTILHNRDESISISFEEVAPADWQSKVYEPDILGKWPTLTKEPGYGKRP